MPARHLVAALITALAPLAAAEPTAPQFKGGDTVCFIGDSITHGGFYAPNIQLFYTLRFPERKIAWCNRGITGDIAGGAVKRFDWDIAPCKPTVATIMLGMNDVGRGLYGQPEPTKQVLDQRRWNLEGYAKNMGELASRLGAMKTSLILITPSPFDQTGTQKAPNNLGVNDALATCAATCRELAAKTGAGLVDFHGPMTALNAERQKADPAFTIVGGDRVHPQASGELMMTWLFLKAQGIGPTVATMAVDAAAATTSAQENCTISELAAKPDTIAFTVVEKALPYPIFKNQAPTLAFVPFTQELNQEILRVTGLAAGNWALAIDGKQVATCTAAELAAGLNLAVNDKTPMYGQAMLVADHHFKRQILVAGKLRTIAAVQHQRLAAKNIAFDDYAAGKAALEPLIAAEKSDYVRGLMTTWVEWKPKEADLQAQVAALDAKMQADNQPKPHRFEIKRAP